MNRSELIAVRDALPSDRNFILATWLRGIFYGDSWYSEVPKNIFMEQYHKVVEYIISNPKTRVKVACLKEDPEVILGYAVLNQDQTALNFVFVKKSWRTIGIAKQLVPLTVTTVTNLTKVGLSISKRKGLHFNPFIV